MKLDLRILVPCRADVREPSAVGRPSKIAKSIERRLVDLRLRLLLNVIEPQLPILIVMRNPLTIRRRYTLPAKHLPIIRQLLTIADAIGR